MVLRTVLTALLALRALSSASLALSDACGTAERVRVNWLDRFYLGAWFGEVGGPYHASHHHVAFGLGLLPLQLLLSGAQLIHHGVHLVVQHGGVLEGLLCVILGLGRTLREKPGNHQDVSGKGPTAGGALILSYFLHVAGYLLCLCRLVLRLPGICSCVAKRCLRLPGLVVGRNDSGVDGWDLFHGVLGSGFVVVHPLVKV